jgi:hypothetical protein
VKTALTILALVTAWEFVGWMARLEDRRAIFARALEEARRAAKPLLVVGCPKAMGVGWPVHPCGDVTVDVAECPECPDAVRASVEDLRMFPDGAFGAAFVGHVLEEVKDLPAAWSELNRVADAGYVAAVSPHFLAAWGLPKARSVIYAG